MVGEKSNPLQVWIDGGIQLISDPDFRSEGSALAHIALAVKDVSATVSSVKDLGGFSQANGDNWMELPDGLCLEILHT